MKSDPRVFPGNVIRTYDPVLVSDGLTHDLFKIESLRPPRVVAVSYDPLDRRLNVLPFHVSPEVFQAKFHLFNPVSYSVAVAATKDDSNTHYFVEGFLTLACAYEHAHELRDEGNLDQVRVQVCRDFGHIREFRPDEPLTIEDGPEEGHIIVFRLCGVECSSLDQVEYEVLSSDVQVTPVSVSVARRVMLTPEDYDIYTHKLADMPDWLAGVFSDLGSTRVVEVRDTRGRLLYVEPGKGSSPENILFRGMPVPLASCAAWATGSPSLG